MTFKSDFLHTLETRGYIHQVSEPERLDALAAAGPITAYIGFDATAPSLHAGHLVSIMMLRWLQKTGNTPIVLMGGGTTKIGDPSGKDEARKLLSSEEIDAISSALSSKSNTSKLLAIREGFTDLGITILPSLICHRISTWAGVLPRSSATAVTVG